MPYWDRIPRLDRRHALQGVTFSSMTLWRLPQNDNAVDVVVLADTAFGSDEGKVLLVANCGGATVYTDGDYTAGCVWAGVAYDAILELSEFAIRNEQGVAVNAGEVLVRDVTVRHRKTGKYQITVTPDSSNFTTRKTTFEAGSNDIQQQGRTSSFVGHFADTAVLKVEADGPKPVTVATVEAEVDWTDKTSP